MLTTVTINNNRSVNEQSLIGQCPVKQRAAEGGATVCEPGQPHGHSGWPAWLAEYTTIYRRRRR